MEKLKAIFTLENIKKHLNADNFFMYTLTIGVLSMTMFLALCLFGMSFGIYLQKTLITLVSVGFVFAILIPVGVQSFENSKEFIQYTLESLKNVVVFMKRFKKINENH